MNSLKYCTYITIFKFKNSDCKQKFIDFANSDNGLIVTKNYTGCLELNLYSSKNDKNKMILIQKWDNIYNKKKYLKMREIEGTYKFLNTLVESPFNLDLLTSINLNSKL